MFRKSRHASQAILISVRKFIVFLEIERGHTHKLFVDKSTKMESKLIIVTLEDTIFERAIEPQHPLSDVMGIDRFDS